MAEGTIARLCMSIDPESSVADGPYVLVGSTEYSLPEAEVLGASLITLAGVGATSSHRAAVEAAGASSPATLSQVL